MPFQPSDLVTILVLVVLEGLLSGDNALILAVIVQPLPPDQQRKALHYGMAGAFVLRILATLLAVELVRWKWISLIGGVYLLYLPYKHFARHPEERAAAPAPEPERGIFGLSMFWIIVLKADWLDLVFALDSILAAVAMTGKTWVIIAGGLLGILMMRLLTLQVLHLIQRYPRLIDGAYVVVAWIGIKLIWKYAHEVLGVLPWALPEWLSITVVFLLFAGSFLYAHAQAARPGAASAGARDAEQLVGRPVNTDQHDTDEHEAA